MAGVIDRRLRVAVRPGSHPPGPRLEVERLATRTREELDRNRSVLDEASLVEHPQTLRAYERIGERER